MKPKQSFSGSRGTLTARTAQKSPTIWTITWRRGRFSLPSVPNSGVLYLDPADPMAQSWLWYATETADCVQLDRRAYPKPPFDWEVVPLPEWVRRPPAVLATEGCAKACPLCGSCYTVLHGRECFADPAVIGRPLIVNSNGLFVRRDIAARRGLRTPRGAFEPGVVAFEPSRA